MNTLQSFNHYFNCLASEARFESTLNTGYFGEFGGSFVPDILSKPLADVAKAFAAAISDPQFIEDYHYYLKQYVGRENPLYYAKHLSESLGGAKIYLKREDLNHTGAHKINNAIGQILLAKRMGKTRIIAETGAGQHGVATATVAALMGLPCTVYMGEVDTERQSLNVFRMKLMGASVIPVTSGSRTLKDAVDAAIMDFASNPEDTFYLLGSAVGPHPYPLMVRTFQSIIGLEAKRQILEQEGRLPDTLIAAVGGGSNAMGLFHAFEDDLGVAMIGVEPAGKGLHTKDHAAPLALGKVGIIQGFKCHVLLDSSGEPSPVHSVAAGLDYPGVGPEHSALKESQRAAYESITDSEALEAFHLLSRTEGIIPALESAHAVAFAIKLAPQKPKDHIFIVNLSGRGDKDVAQVMDLIQL